MLVVVAERETYPVSASHKNQMDQLLPSSLIGEREHVANDVMILREDGSTF